MRKRERVTQKKKKKRRKVAKNEKRESVGKREHKKDRKQWTEPLEVSTEISSRRNLMQQKNPYRIGYVR